MATILGGMSVLNSTLGLLQRIAYSRRIERTQLAASPIFVLGHWRSGTTLLHELLVLDQSFTFPNTYACFCPNHFLVSESWLKFLVTFFLPKQRPMDNMKIGWNLPQEDEWALCNMGLPSPYFKVMFPNLPMVDHDYQTLSELTASQRSHWQQGLLRLMKCLTIREPKRIVLKTPLHTFRVAVIRELFPDAKFIHITRDPFVLFPRRCIHGDVCTGIKRFRFPLMRIWRRRCCRLLWRCLRLTIETVNRFPRISFIQLSYESLVANPIGAMERAYAHFDLPINAQVREAWNQYASSHKNYEKNRHELTASQRAAIISRWRPYLIATVTPPRRRHEPA